jgi:hypothetical protein
MDLRIYPLPLPNIPTMISMMRFLLFLKLEVVGFSTSPSPDGAGLFHSLRRMDLSISLAIIFGTKLMGYKHIDPKI